MNVIVFSVFPDLQLCQPAIIYIYMCVTSVCSPRIHLIVTWQRQSIISLHFYCVVYDLLAGYSVLQPSGETIQMKNDFCTTLSVVAGINAT